jgi:hypothetical protein
MRTGLKFSWVLAAAMMTLATAPAAAQEQVMSKNPSECEVFSALSGDNSCKTEPSAGGQSVEGETQGLAINTENGQGSGTAPSTTANNSPRPRPRAMRNGDRHRTQGGDVRLDPVRVQFGRADRRRRAARLTRWLTFCGAISPTRCSSSKATPTPRAAPNKSDSVGTACSGRLRYLVQKGVAAPLSACGMGERALDKSNPDAAVNRRVVVLNLGG